MGFEPITYWSLPRLEVAFEANRPIQADKPALADLSSYPG